MMASMLRRLTALTLAAGAASCGSLSRPGGEGVDVRTQILGGYQAVDTAAYEGHAVVGLEFVTYDPETQWGYELGGLFGTESLDRPSADLEANFHEVFLGLRRSWVRDSWRSYVGLGASWARVANRLHPAGGGASTSFEDDSGGGYVRTGILWDVGRFPFDRGTSILVGFDARALVGEDLDALTGALVLAFGL
jgi:hypothetical protein